MSCVQSGGSETAPGGWWVGDSLLSEKDSGAKKLQIDGDGARDSYCLLLFPWAAWVKREVALWLVAKKSDLSRGYGWLLEKVVDRGTSSSSIGSSIGRVEGFMLVGYENRR